MVQVSELPAITGTFLKWILDLIQEYVIISTHMLLMSLSSFKESVFRCSPRAKIPERLGIFA